jgi:Rps23 Pro-64 3,4-dihydroxylase Tpa1-like proline 4-hydroxylase
MHPAALTLATETAAALHTAYAGAIPFPHIVVDNFLPDQAARLAVEKFPFDGADIFSDRAQERSKRQINPDTLDGNLRALFMDFNAAPFIQVVEAFTGIKGLIPDPWFLGGGFHEIKTGGYLSMHADFNYHKRMNLERRVNVLIYLNDGWEDAFGGQLELWDSRMQHKIVSVVPAFNRCVIFNTTSGSMHGNPNPVAHPKGTPRRSIALYYYTATWDGSKREHTTKFSQRPGSGDRFDWKLGAVNLALDWLPPAILRALRRGK